MRGIERVAAAERIDAIMSEPGNAFVQMQSPGIEYRSGECCTGDGNASRSRRGGTMKQPHPHEPAYRGESGSV